MTITQITTNFGITQTPSGWLPYNLDKQRTFGFPSETAEEAAEKATAQQARIDATAAEDEQKARTAQAAAEKQAEIAKRNEAIVNADINARTSGLATPRQVDYIMSLIARGAHEEGGYIYGPTTREGVEQMTKGAASAYIDSLTNRY